MGIMTGQRGSLETGFRLQEEKKSALAENDADLKDLGV